MENSKRRNRSKKKISSKDRSKFLNIALIVLSVALVLVLVLGTLKDKKVLANNKSEYQESTDSKESTSNSDKTKEEAPENAYEKIKAGKEINILVLGDGIGLSEGKSNEDGAWTSLLSNWIKETYNSSANITNLSENKGNVKDGLKALEGNKDSFDLVYIMFGQNDQKTLSTKEFKENYEQIIENLKERNEKTTIIPVIENSMRKKNDYTNIIEELANSNNLTVLDMATSFTKDPAPYSKLTTKGGIYPNDLGYSVYFADMKSSIEAHIAELK